MNDVTKDLLDALSYVVDAWIDGNGSEWNQSDSATKARKAIAFAKAQQKAPVRLTDFELMSLCQSKLVGGYYGDYLENDGYDLAREVEVAVLHKNGLEVAE